MRGAKSWTMVVAPMAFFSLNLLTSFMSIKSHRHCPFYSSEKANNLLQILVKSLSLGLVGLRCFKRSYYITSQSEYFFYWWLNVEPQLLQHLFHEVATFTKVIFFFPNTTASSTNFKTALLIILFYFYFFFNL